MNTVISTRWAQRLALFALASLSIGSLLLYFLGVSSFSAVATLFLAVEVIGIALLYLTAAPGSDLRLLVVAGLWAGLLATLAYDIVRVPIVQSGIPVFKAISYFGTVFMAVDRPTPLSEIAGWGYHLSNGVSFAMMYAALVPKAGPITGVVWGLFLEGIMLFTPYAEVFGYQRDARFLAITVGSHAVYGLVLWLGLKHWSGLAKKRVWFGAAAASVPLALAAVSVHSMMLHAQRIPASPPPYIGPDLYTTWNVPEPDRVLAIWATQRLAEPDAKFHFIEPFEKIVFGRPFDVPEAEIRRHGTQSATEYVVDLADVPDTERLQELGALARMTNFTEVSPWMLASDPEAGRLAESIRGMADRLCGQSLSARCLPSLLDAITQWYDGGLE